jgi:putative FmdB family regulatory protein
MPLYEYRCTSCGHELEVLQKVSAPSPVDCPSCQQPKLQKKLSAAGFQLKGTGWYVTDFRGDKKSPSDSSSKTESELNTPTAETGEKNNAKSETAASSDGVASTASASATTSATASQTKSTPTANASVSA